MTTPTFDLCWLQTMGGGGDVLQAGIPAADALSVLAREQQQALAGEHGAGVVVYLRPAGEHARDQRLREEIDRLVGRLADEVAARTAVEAALQSDALREALADYAHQAWSGWMAYLFEKSVTNADGTVTIPSWAVERWTRQVGTSYTELSDVEKESDRVEAARMLERVRAVLQPGGDP